MPDANGRSPASGFFLGIALAVGALFISWLAYLEGVRADRVMNTNFEFDHRAWILIPILLVVAGAVFGMIIILALRGPSRSRRATLLGGAVLPALLVVVFWWFAFVPVSVPLMSLASVAFLTDQITQTVAAVSLGMLVILAAVPADLHDDS